MVPLLVPLPPPPLPPVPPLPDALPPPPLTMPLPPPPDPPDPPPLEMPLPLEVPLLERVGAGETGCVVTTGRGVETGCVDVTGRESATLRVGETVRLGETVAPELLGLEIWGALTWAARVEPDGTRRVCRCADEAIRADLCLGFDWAVAMSLGVAVGLCEGTGGGELAGATG
jgi:hypothetical protein